ncbi:MAG: NTP transferase domain-containing protein [Deltaproteobacteria bacterium]|nr:NTP transferase domain-containing protein [Deltaproteobacteria bacterium]
MNSPDKAIRCGVVLAAGEGRRLRPFVQQLRGDFLPKQYVRFVGTRSMLEHTFSRAEKLIPPERLFTVISRKHLSHPEVRQQLSQRPQDRLVVQPENKETGPGILLPLMHVEKRYPDSTVAVLPSDHFVAEEGLFMSYVDLAFRIVERHPSYLILLGIQPTAPEAEYGYIVPGPKVDFLAPLPVLGLARFVEKPRSYIAEELIRKGGLWNTMVIVSKVRTLLDLVRDSAPGLYRCFETIGRSIGTSREKDVVERSYRQMEPVNFSSDLFEAFPVERVLVLPVRGVVWSDWGSKRRVLDFLKQRHGSDRFRTLSRNRSAATTACAWLDVKKSTIIS